MEILSKFLKQTRGGINPVIGTVSLIIGIVIGLIVVNAFLSTQDYSSFSGGMQTAYNNTVSNTGTAFTLLAVLVIIIVGASMLRAMGIFGGSRE